MIGHGRPASMALALARAAIVVCALLTDRVAAQSVPLAEPVQLRITWGGGDAIRWAGRIAIDGGSLANLKLLESDPDAVGSIWLDQGEVRADLLSAHKVDSIEVAAQAGPNGKLLIELAPNDKGRPPTLEIPISDLQRHPYQVRLDERGNTLEVQVVPPQPLRIVASREPLIFAPGDKFSFEMTPALPNVSPGTVLAIQTTLTPLSPECRAEAPWINNQRLPVPVDANPKLALDVPLPKTEGVYKVHISVARPSGFDKLWTAPTRLATSTRLAERSFQIVVLDERAPVRAADGRWESVLEIDPTNPRWIERLPSWTQLRRIPGLNHGALGSSYAQSVELPLGRFVELLPTPPAADPHWQAYSLPLEAVSVPHMLEVDYPADAEQHLGISIVEPGANGLVTGANRDSGVYVEGLGRSEAKQKQTQRLVFWPRTQAPLLVVTNMHPTAAAHFGQIRVLKRTSMQLSAGLPADIGTRRRLITAYLARPTATETFGAMRSSDAQPLGGSAADSIDDPETAYQSAARLADYLRYSGYNSAIVSPNSVGQSGAAATGALNVDSTELMLRIFDREGLSLLPAIDFGTPIAALESLRRKNDPQISGLQWVGRDGRTWLATHGTQHGRAPYYNLLDPQVQQVMLGCVRESIERFGRHRAFAGLAIQLSSDGFAQLPPLEWGLDDATFMRFTRDSGIQSSDSGPDRFEARYKLVTGQQASQWRSWRAQQVSRFYSQLASLVRGNGDRRLVLTTENVFANPQLAESMRPNLIAENATERDVGALLDIGIDRQSLEAIPGVMLCPTRYVEPMTSLPDRATDLELNAAFAGWRQSATPSQSRGVALYHRPVFQRLSSFEIAGRPWRVAGEMQMVCQPLPQGMNVRQPYVEALACHDPSMIIDGGERLPIGQEDLLRDMRLMLAQLPTSAEVSEITKQPIVVRTYAEPGRVTLVAMNTSPWPYESVITLDVPQPGVLERLTSTASDAVENKIAPLPAGRQQWPRRLGPYEINVVRIQGSPVKVVDVELKSDSAKSELSATLADLNNRDLTAPSNYRVLTNPGFEPLANGGRISGWRLASTGKATAELDLNRPQEGKTSLHLHSNGEVAIVESDPFPATSTGQLAMTVYARGQNLAPTSELRLIIKGDCDGQPYEYAQSVTANMLQAGGEQWGQPFALLEPNLPLQSRGQARVAFELTGTGDIWLDNVVLHNLLFSLNYYPNYQTEVLELSKQIRAAKSAFDAGQVSDCARIVDGYWPRFIQANRPLQVPKVAERVVPQTAPLPPQTNEGQETSPGFGDRFKRLWPITR